MISINMTPQEFAEGFIRHDPKMDLWQDIIEITYKTLTNKHPEGFKSLKHFEDKFIKALDLAMDEEVRSILDLLVINKKIKVRMKNGEEQFAKETTRKMSMV